MQKFKCRFLIASLLFLSLSLNSYAGLLDEDDGDIIQPDVLAKGVEVAQLDTEFFELGAYVGLLSIEDFGTQELFGLSANFHATEDLFIQANYATATIGTSTIEKVNSAKFFNNRKYEAYDFLVGWNLFPGEVFVSKNWTFNSAFYLLAGVGNTELADEKNFTITWGSGYRIIIMEGLSWHLDYKDHIFETELLGKSKISHNIEISSGVNYFF